MRGHRLEQADKKAKRRVKGMSFDFDDYKPDYRQYRKTTKRCSCWMCGNRRKHEGLPISELREMQDEFLP